MTTEAAGERRDKGNHPRPACDPARARTPSSVKCPTIATSGHDVNWALRGPPSAGIMRQRWPRTHRWNGGSSSRQG